MVRWGRFLPALSRKTKACSESLNGKSRTVGWIICIGAHPYSGPDAFGPIGTFEYWDADINLWEVAFLRSFAQFKFEIDGLVGNDIRFFPVPQTTDFYLENS